jgi:hypothetical protein
MSMDPHYVDPTGVIYIVSGAGGSVKNNAPTTSCGVNAFFLDERVLFTQVLVLDNALVILAIDSDGRSWTSWHSQAPHIGCASLRPVRLLRIFNPSIRDDRLRHPK